MTIQEPTSGADSHAPEAQALDRLMLEFRPALTRYFVRRVKLKDEIPDLIQEVFVRLLRRDDSTHLESVRGYVFETAHSVAIDWLRRYESHRRGVHETFDTQLHGGAECATDQLLMGREDLECVISALMELPERTRAVFILRRMESMKFKDIAVRLGVSLSTVEQHMYRAMAHLMSRLREGL
ncbi:MAG: RNA polymerase sigma factor [Gammaproteobacteria bacterium]|nr:RNA polymerase sigma factor [Gammaproteobacteria bacterium]